MERLLKAFKKFKQEMHEMENGDKMKNMSPHTTIYDLQHHFSEKTGKASKILDRMLLKEPEVYHTALNSYAYANSTPQNQVLFHGVLFKALFNIYMANLKKSFDNVLLSEAQNKYLQNRKVIDFIEYNQMPKRFRGIFVKYDADHYVLNTPHSEMAIAYNKKDQNKLEKLLLKAQRLLPVIYKTKNEYESNKTLAFVEDSPFARYVNDEQLNTIYELHDIFIEIAKITSPIAINQRKDSAVLEIFAEYQKECQQKDIFVRAQYDAKTLKADHDKTIKDAYDSFEKQKEQMEANYKEHRSELLKKLTNETCVLAK